MPSIGSAFSMASVVRGDFNLINSPSAAPIPSMRSFMGMRETLIFSTPSITGFVVIMFTAFYLSKSKFNVHYWLFFVELTYLACF
jgi:hypothetical protein